MTVDQELKVQALQCAVGGRLAKESAKKVVENAKEYFKFLSAGSEPVDGPAGRPA